MADVSHNFGTDMDLASNGDLLPVDAVSYSNQRILRRLLTNPGDYIWQLDYGAGLRKRIGSPYTIPEITGLIKSQMYLEKSVVQSPEPDISVTKISDGISVQIIYTEASTNTTTPLTFSVTP